MALRKTTNSALLVAGLIQVLALAVGCGGGDGGHSDAQGGLGNDAGATSSEGGSPVDTGGTTGNGGSGSETSEGGNTTGGSEIGNSSTAPEFEGVDLDGVTLVSAPGCVGGYNVDERSLALSVDEESHLVLLDALDGNLRANAQVCSAPDGSPVFAGDVEHLSITGGDADETVIIDLLTGDLGNGLLGSEGAIQIDLASGTDKLVVRGTRGDDHMACASTTSMSDSPVRIDLGSRAHALKASGVENLLASLGPGNDTFDGAESSLRCNLALEIYGGADSDVLIGGSKNDVLNGGDGADEFQMASTQDGRDIVNGGADDDLVSYAKRSKDVSVTLCEAPSLVGCPDGECTCEAISGETGEGDVIVNVEDADGGAGNDTLVGNDLANVLSGKDGSDKLQGLGGADQIYGDAGDDIIEGGADADLLIGGSGKNSIDGGEGDDICFVSTRDASKKNCETPVEVP